MTDSSRDTLILFAARFIRLFAYGSLSVVLVFYLIAIGLTPPEAGLLLTLTLVGDAAISVAMTSRADRIGRRRMLLVGAALMSAAGIAFISTRSFWLLVMAATIGVISPSGQEVGPFLPIEQAILSRRTQEGDRTRLFAWYTLTGALATAAGAWAGGWLSRVADTGSSIGGYRTVVMVYAGLGAVLAVLFSRLSQDASTPVERTGRKGLEGIAASLSGLERSRPVVLRLSALFALDAFGGGFVAQSFAAYWFYLRFGTDPATVGPVFFVANILAGFSALLAARIAARFGLIRTMVWTHLPSNVLLLLIPLMPSFTLAVTLLLLRFSISQMDVPTRQSFVMAVVPPDERSAAGGVTGVARTLAAAVSPLFVGMLFDRPATIALPFLIAGTLKIAYDLLLFRQFARVTLPRHD